MAKINVRSLMDENQKELHTKIKGCQWLQNPDNVENFLLANTFYRRNFHRFAKDYLGLALHWYQSILLYLMGISDTVVAIAARASAKSYIIGVYAVVKCILYPGSMGVIVSGTKGQAKLIVTKKIRDELMRDSPNLRKEVRRVYTSQSDASLDFYNGSTIVAVTLGVTALGNRSTFNVYEEAKTCNKRELDEYISPFKIIRQVPFMKLPDYAGRKEFYEEPCDIYISSSIPEQHWLYKLAKDTATAMISNLPSVFFAADYSVTLKHGIRTRNQLIREKKKLDPISWAVEYENAVLRENTNAFFNYDMVTKCQTLKRAFYPRKNVDVISKVRNPLAIPKQEGEIRIISCDIALIDRAGNDNSCFTCLRLFPEVIEDRDRTKKDFRIKVPYLEGMRGERSDLQAIRIRQLMDDFSADYVVLDAKGAGLGVLDELAKVLYDDERGKEYPPIKAMNDEVFASRCSFPNAEPIIYCIVGSAKLNSEIAFNLRGLMANHRLDLLVDKDEGVEEVFKYIKDAVIEGDFEKQIYYEKPYLETKLMISELLRLEYEMLENTGMVRIKERGKEMKDRYSSLAYGCYFAYQLTLDLINEPEIPIGVISCVSALDL